MCSPGEPLPYEERLGAQLTSPGDDMKKGRVWGLTSRGAAGQIRKVEPCPQWLDLSYCFSHPSYLKILGKDKKGDAFISCLKLLL